MKIPQSVREQIEKGPLAHLTTLNRDGSPQVVHDRCPHRSIKLSVGRIFDGELQCILHGMRFNGEGQCVMVPWEENGEPKARHQVKCCYGPIQPVKVVCCRVELRSVGSQCPRR